MKINSKLLNISINDKHDERLKFCLKVNIFGNSSSMIELMTIDDTFSTKSDDIKIGEVLYSSDKDTFKIIKGEKLKYVANTLYLPTRIDRKIKNNQYAFTYNSEGNRIVLLKMLSKNLFNFLGSGAFGHNKHYIQYHKMYWFFY